MMSLSFSSYESARVGAISVNKSIVSTYRGFRPNGNDADKVIKVGIISATGGIA